MRLKSIFLDFFESEFSPDEMRVIATLALMLGIVYFMRWVLPWFYYNIVGPGIFGPKVNFRRMGQWAVVTGATDGIGKAYAMAMAKRGLNVVLISRSITKLEAVALEITTKYSVAVKVIEVDFTKDLSIYSKIKQQIEDYDIGVLVNNVGISYPHPEYFLNYYEKNPKFLTDIVSANIHSVTHMTALVLGKMVEKKKGVIINISSAASVIPNPLLSVYSASKAFVNKFTEDLQMEYKNAGILIQSVQPGFVCTNMSRIRKPTFLAPSAETYVESALRTVGIAEQTTGYFPHALMTLFIAFVSCITCEFYARAIVFKHLLGIRKKALRQEARQKTRQDTRDDARQEAHED